MKFRHLPLLAAIFSTLIYAQTATPPANPPANIHHNQTNHGKQKTNEEITF